MIANTLARAGVGRLRIVDRDFLELNNLQRQVLFDEADVAANLPKAIAAAEKLREINSTIEIEPVVADVSSNNILSLCEGCDVIVDGTDNFETRFLLNEAAIKLGIPWIYGGCIGSEGQTLTIIPGESPCFRCVMNEPPPPGTSPTCETAGILGPIVNIVASIQAAEAIKILSGNRAAVNHTLSVIDVWENQIRQLNLDQLRGAKCATCHPVDGAADGDRFPYLASRRGSQTAVLCGRNSVQLQPDVVDDSNTNSGSSSSSLGVSFDALAEKLSHLGQITRNKFLLRAAIGEYTITVFPDGRAIVGGTSDIAQARSLYAKYIGS